jgi:hypothetical protein
VPARAKHPPRLGEGAVRIGDGAQDKAEDHGVEGAVGKRQVHPVAVDDLYRHGRENTLIAFSYTTRSLVRLSRAERVGAPASLPRNHRHPTKAIATNATVPSRQKSIPKSIHPDVIMSTSLIYYYYVVVVDKRKGVKVDRR